MEEAKEDPVAKSRTETREYVWKHWAFHADQRLRAFNFFLLVASVILAGLFTYLKDARNPAYAAPICFLLPVFSWIFWRMDCRNRALIRHAEQILKDIERSVPTDLVPERQRLFVQEEAKTDAARTAHGEKRSPKLAKLWNAPFGFYHLFAVVFIVVGLSGVGIGLATLFLPGQQPPAAPPQSQQNYYISAQPVTPAGGPPK